jgi:hypothetical protein
MRQASLRKRWGSIAPQSLHDQTKMWAEAQARSEAMLEGRRPLERWLRKLATLRRVEAPTIFSADTKLRAGHIFKD